MGFAPFRAFAGMRDRIAAALRYRAMKRGVLRDLFAGRPLIERIRLDRTDAPDQGTIFTLFYRNGLMLKVDEGGLADFDCGGDDAADTATEARRAFAPLMRRLVLESLLRHITSPRADPRQRERAAQAASRIWMAGERERNASASAPPVPPPPWAPPLHAPSA